MKKLIVCCLFFCLAGVVYANDNDAVNQAQTRIEKLKLLLAQSKKVQGKNSQIKHLSAKIVELRDTNGLVYVGAAVNKIALDGYLQQMKLRLGTQKFQLYRSNQLARDNHGFHVTLINPFEYQVLTKKVNFGQKIRFTLQGLGKVATKAKKADKTKIDNDNSESYFVVTSSVDGQFFRQQYLLKPKDFHITLGFNPHDIYNLSKGKERLVK